MHPIQKFPAVTIEAMSNGLFRLEDESRTDGSSVIDLHPAQVQVLASMVGLTMPDKSRAALARIASRLEAIKAQVSDLESRLSYALNEQDMDMAPELVSAEFIGLNLGEVLKDIDALTVPGIEPTPNAAANPGGQLTLPM
jgi:hypothetical protein